jgi:hypothetical protein
MLVADVLLEFLIRVCVNLFLRIRSLKWPEIRGQIDSANVERGLTGCAIAEVHYFYLIGDETFGGYFKEPYLIKDRTQDYIHEFPAESQAQIRVKPGNPSNSFLAGA